MLQKHRQQVIKHTIDQNQFASVKELTEKSNASEATIRRDLTQLANRGDILKINGGAQSILHPPVKRYLSSSTFREDKTKRGKTKRAIAQRATELCKEGESIIINGGSSTYMMGEFLVKMRMRILTNSYVLANDLIESSECEISLPGGEVYREQGIILSSYEKDIVEYYHGTKLFMGTPGIGKHGVMESDPLLIRSEQKLKKQADQLVVLADSSKLGNRSNFILCPLSEVDILITDSDATIELIRFFESNGIQVIIVAAID
jgi:DeoR family ulaG and ulaABCDEF operon transcriptional repressor